MIMGDEVRLWALERHDLIQNYQWANDPELIRLAGLDPTPKAAQAIEGWFDSIVRNQRIQIFAIKTADGDYLGNIELTSIDRQCGKAEVGLMLGNREAWGKGYASRALQAMLGYAYGELRLHRLYARVLEFNQRAWELFERNGFQLEGTERQSHFTDGSYHDVRLYGRLATDS